MMDVNEELMYNIHNAPQTEWTKGNIGNITWQFLTSNLVESVPYNYIDDDDLANLTFEEKTYLTKLLGVFQFIDEGSDKSDWSTKNIGTFFVKMAMEQDVEDLYEIHDAFTPPGDNVSWPDIALMYNLKDFRVLKYESKLNTPARYKEPEPCNVDTLFCSPGSPKRYSSFQNCFRDVMGKMDEEESFDEHTFKKEFIARKDIQPSPCSDLAKFPSCNDYCTWHEDYFKTIKKSNFLQAMSYASHQRKIVKDSIPHEKEIAGKHFNKV